MIPGHLRRRPVLSSVRRPAGSAPAETPSSPGGSDDHTREEYVAPRLYPVPAFAAWGSVKESM
jgi:hypothetical protein